MKVYVPIRKGDHFLGPERPIDVIGKTEKTSVLNYLKW